MYSAHKQIALSFLAFAIACSDHGEIVAPDSPPLSTEVPTLADLNLIARFIDAPPHRTNRTAAKLIGPEGGTLRLAGFSVFIPPGALSTQTEISLRLPAFDSPGADRVMAEFEPHGIEFAQPVTLIFPLRGTSAEGSNGRIVWWSGASWVPLKTEVGAGRASTTVDHFSTYALDGSMYCVPASDPDADPSLYCRYPSPDNCPSCIGLWVEGWTESNCFSYTALWFVDGDGDNVDDYCEAAIAYAFRPDMQFASHGCNWDSSLARMGGEYLWAVQRSPIGTSGVRVAYLPAYYRDCGAPYLGGAHVGDSEFAYVDLYFDASTNHWYGWEIFLSAHCGTLNDGKCKLWDPSAFYWVDGRNRGAPVIYVSGEKHANFPSSAECGYFDYCSTVGPRHRFPAYRPQNIGSRNGRLLDCIQALSSSGNVVQKDECMWSEPSGYMFTGWQSSGDGEGSTPYGQILRGYIAF